MSEQQMTQAEIDSYHEERLLALKYLKDMREVMASKPHWSEAPEKAKSLGLNVESGEKFGTWVWLTIVPQKGYLYLEQRPIEYVNRI